MSDPITITIPGIPAPGGSKRAFALRRRDGSLVRRADGSPVINVTDAGGERTKNWRAVCALAARQQYQGPPLTGPLMVHFTFLMPRPKGHYRSDGVRLRPSAPTEHTKKPDRTKLLRSTEDALTGILWVDDTQIVNGTVTKSYATDHTGAIVTVIPLEKVTGC